MKRLCLLLLILLAACGAPRIALPPAPETAVFLDILEQGADRWQQLDAAAEVGFNRAGKHISTRQFMLLEKPDRLRVDVLSLFSQLALQLRVADGELEVFLNTSVPGQYYRGPVSDELLARFTRLPLRAKELVQILLYSPPRGGSPAARVDTEGEFYRLTLDSTSLRQQFFFDRELRLRRCVYLQNEAVVLRVDYDRFGSEDRFPRRVEIAMPQQETRVTLVYSELKLNQPVKSGRFQLKPPANAVPLQIPGLDLPEERS